MKSKLIKKMGLAMGFALAGISPRPLKTSPQGDNDSREITLGGSRETLDYLLQPTEAEIARVRQHPIYQVVKEKLDKAEYDFYDQTVVPRNAADIATLDKDAAAQEIIKNLRPLRTGEHLGIDREREINEAYVAEVQALKDAGYDPYK